MKQCLPIFLLITLAIAGCKKYKTGDQGTPEGNKKWIVSTIAGDGSPLYADGPALSAKFRAPQDVAVTENGDLYVADALNHRIRKIAGGLVTTFAGSDIEDTVSGTGTNAHFAHPTRIVADKFGHLFTLDVSDYRVRTITAAALVTVAAGSGVRGFADGPGITAKFGACTGIHADEWGNVYVSDDENKRIRIISLTGTVSTMAGTGQSGTAEGTGTTAQFTLPTGIVMDGQSNLYVADQTRIRKISPQRDVSTFVGSIEPGSADGPSTMARFKFIEDMAIDDKGNIYVTDDNRIRKIAPNGDVTTIAGSTPGYKDGDGPSAQFNGANGLDVDKQGNIYVADNMNNRIRKISLQ
jgi:hypothetical protein